MHISASPISIIYQSFIGEWILTDFLAFLQLILRVVHRHGKENSGSH